MPESVWRGAALDASDLRGERVGGYRQKVGQAVAEPEVETQDRGIRGRRIARAHDRVVQDRGVQGQPPGQRQTGVHAIDRDERRGLVASGCRQFAGIGHRSEIDIDTDACAFEPGTISLACRFDRREHRLCRDGYAIRSTPAA